MDNTAAANEPRSRTERTARLVGLGGAAFLILLAVWLNAIDIDHPWRAGTITLLTLYAIALLAFLGGVRWAMTFSERDHDGEGSRNLYLGALPPAIAPLIAFVETPAVFGVLAAAFAALGAWDSLAAHSGAAPAWYGQLRIQLTVLIVAALILAFVATS